MITEIGIEGFKSLEKVHLKLGGFNLFIGANASGKSNFFEALRVLQGIGYGFTIDEVFNGKPKGATSEVWEGIRGGASRAAFSRRGAPPWRGVQMAVRLKPTPSGTLTYSIWFLPAPGSVEAEELASETGQIFEREGGDLAISTGDNTELEVSGLDPQRSALDGALVLGVAGKPQREVIENCLRALSNVQRLDPVPAQLRAYSQTGSARRIGERGENFAALAKSILAREELRSAYVSWLEQLTPTELDDFTILEGALGEPLFALRQNGNAIPAPVLSDGTLRFAALAAAFFQPEMPDILTLEEIENGIHPSRLRLLVELLKSQSAAGTPGGPQVFATTHSPIVLAWLEESDYETTFLCRRDEETGASIIKPISEIPHLIEVVRKQPISELFAEGWLEGAF